MLHSTQPVPVLPATTADTGTIWPRAGIYVDWDNVHLNGANDLEFQILRDLVAGDLRRFRVYRGCDELRRRSDPGYAWRLEGFRRGVVRAGGDLFLKDLKQKTRGTLEYLSGDIDAVLATDVMADCADLRLRRVLLVTGDGDFLWTVRALKARRVYVMVLGFNNVHWRLKREANEYVNGCKVAGLVRPRLPRRSRPVTKEEGRVLPW